MGASERKRAIAPIVAAMAAIGATAPGYTQRSLTAGINRYVPHQGAKQRAKYAKRLREQPPASGGRS